MPELNSALPNDQIYTLDQSKHKHVAGFLKSTFLSTTEKDSFTAGFRAPGLAAEVRKEDRCSVPAVGQVIVASYYNSLVK